MNRPQLGRDGRWEDAITWNEVQEVKSQAGLGNRWAVEVFPPDDQVIDEAAIRHLWLLDEAPPFAWAERLP